MGSQTSKTSKLSLSWYLSYLFLFSVILWPISNGYGHNWDGTYHLFRSQFPDIGRSYFSVWSSADLGASIGYASGSLYGLILGFLHITGLETQWQQYIYLVALLAAIAYLCRLIIARYIDGGLLPLLFSLACVLNPAVFYKLLAGHTIYLTGLVFFLALVYYMLHFYQALPRNSLVAGLLTALSMVQIQFAIFSTLVLALYIIMQNRKRWLANLGLSLLVIVLIHGYWLVPLLTNSDHILDLSNKAKTDYFASLISTTLPRVWTFLFSGATFIHYFFPYWFQALSGLIVVYIFVLFLKNKKRDPDVSFFMILFLVFSLLATGLLQSLNIPIFRTFSPLLREVGHLAPLVIIGAFLLIASLYRYSPQQKWQSTTLGVCISIFIGFSAIVIYNYTPRFNAKQARAEFAPFLSVINQTQNTTRILTYPFFNQYQYLSQPITYKGSTPMSNSGWDSFTIFSGTDSISNAVSPSLFKDSIQYQFLTDYSVDRLADLNIRYILDYSAIYQSNYDHFVDPSVYNNDLTLIKNDPNFLNKVLAANPGKVRLISPHVLEISNFQPRIKAGQVIIKKLNETQYVVQGSLGGRLDLLVNYDPGWKLYKLPGSSPLCNQPEAGRGGGECSAVPKILTGLEFAKKQPLVSVHSPSSAGWNRWDIPGPDQSGTYLIYYQPQGRFLVMVAISLLTIIGLIIYIFVGHRKD